MRDLTAQEFSELHKRTPFILSIQNTSSEEKEVRLLDVFLEPSLAIASHIDGTNYNQLLDLIIKEGLDLSAIYFYSPVLKENMGSYTIHLYKRLEDGGHRLEIIPIMADPYQMQESVLYIKKRMIFKKGGGDYLKTVAPPLSKTFLVLYPTPQQEEENK